MSRSFAFVLVFPIVTLCLFPSVSVAASGYDGPAQLPIASVASSIAQTPAAGSIVTVNAGENLIQRTPARNGAEFFGVKRVE